MHITHFNHYTRFHTRARITHTDMCGVLTQVGTQVEDLVANGYATVVRVPEAFIPDLPKVRMYVHLRVP